MKILSTVIGSLMLLNASAQQYDGLKIPHPEQGKKISISYVADSTVLSSAKQISGKAYFYTPLQQSGTESFHLEKKAGSWKGRLYIPDGVVMLSLVFDAGDVKHTDNNQDQGYLFPVYKQGKSVQFAHSRMADLLGGGPPDPAGIKKNQKQALVFMKEEIRLHPESEQTLRPVFYNMLANSPEREDKVDLLIRLNTMKSEREEDLIMAQLYFSYFGGKKQADSLDKLLLTKFPEGKYVKAKREQVVSVDTKAESDHLSKVSASSAINNEEILKKVKASLVNEATKSISLNDLYGNAVAIGEGALKGKVIILDFWATWCKPCIASFPAMQKVIDRYKNNPDVQFLFIATMEQGDALKNVKQFMAKNSYSFTVLLDEKTEDMNLYKAYSNYKAAGGIPYKLILDGNGHIRARSAGFSGNEDEFIAELSAMIDIALKSGK
jgi:thiol-disulfide isomerase/thioredoxin